MGIAPPPVYRFANALKPAAQVVVNLIPQLRRIVASGRKASLPIPLTGQGILLSLEDSLRRLGTDHVDVLALHDPNLNELAREDVATSLVKAVQSGKARATGIAGTLEAGLTALKIGLPISHIQ